MAYTAGQLYDELGECTSAPDIIIVQTPDGRHFEIVGINYHPLVAPLVSDAPGIVAVLRTEEKE